MVVPALLDDAGILWSRVTEVSVTGERRVTEIRGGGWGFFGMKGLPDPPLSAAHYTTLRAG